MSRTSLRRDTDLQPRWTRLLPARVREITKPEVAVTGLAAAFLAVLYSSYILVSPSIDFVIGAAIVRLIGALTIVALVICLRDRFPLWIGYIGAVAELFAFVVFVGFSIDHEQLVFRMQEFPLIALYLAWVFPRTLAQLTVYPIMLFTLPFAILYGPASGTDYQQGLLNCLSLFFFTFLAMFAGDFAKRNFTRETETDELTGAINRRGLGRQGEAILQASRKRSRPLVLCLIDLDGFKQINDTLGHEAGDKALQELVTELKSSLRNEDLVCRLGGDEFVVLLNNTTLTQAQLLMQRTHENSSHAWSYGLAQAHNDDNLSTIILRADRQMYSFKQRRT